MTAALELFECGGLFLRKKHPLSILGILGVKFD